MKKNSKIISLVVGLIFIFGIFWFVSQTGAFSGPSTPPNILSSGVLRFDPTTGNLGIGISANSSARLRILSSSTYPGLKILNTAFSPVFEVGPTEVLIGNPTDYETLYGTGISLRVNGIKASSSYFNNLYVNQARVYGTIVGNPGSSISGFDLISANTVSSTFSASNISAGVFGSGNFAFPGKLGVNTLDKDNLPASLSVYGTGYFSGNVGIGVDSASLTGPASLNIGNSPSWLQDFHKGIFLYGSSSIEFNGGGSTLYGIGVSSNRLFIFNTNTESNPSGAPSFYNLTLNSSGVGVGTNNPQATLHVSGTLRITGASGFQLATTTNVSGYVLTADTSGNGTWQPAGGISGGVSGDTARYNGTSWVASSLLYNDGTFIGVGTTVSTNGTLLKVGPGGYLQLDKSFSGTAPTPTDCDNVAENGRITYGTSTVGDYFFYVCISNQWRAVKLN